MTNSATLTHHRIAQPFNLKQPRADMVWIPGGRFLMGSNDHYPEEAPARHVTVEGFWMDSKPVTNREFAAFVKATHWVTSAEIAPKAEDYIGADPTKLLPASLVFTPTTGPVDLHDNRLWWRYQPGANWRCPYGPDSTLAGLAEHPVVHIAWRDAVAYAEWAHVDLPTEAQWELAARGGLEGAVYPWGDELTPNGEHLANVWQGRFPYENRNTDGWVRTSPVGFFPPNDYGLFDMVGNVWEWTQDWWSTQSDHGDESCCAGASDVRERLSIDQRDSARIPRKVIKGGSHLCAPNYCQRYRPAARHPHPIDTSTSHIGFRCVATS